VEELKENIKTVEYKIPRWFNIYQKIYYKNKLFRFVCDRIYYLIPDVIEQYYFNKTLLEHYLKDLLESDIIFPNNGIWGVKLANKIRSKAKIPFIYTGHGGIGDGEKKILRYEPNKYIVLTEETKDWASKYYHNVIKIHNGVSLKNFPIGLNQSEGQKNILCVASFTPFKRQKLIIDAVENIKNVNLILLGSGELLEELEEYGRQKLKNRFEIKSVSYNEIKIYYSKCDVFSLPSLNEPFGIAYLEALASNKPIVAPDDKNRREIIGNAGIYCDVTNSQEYAKALVNAINVRWNDIPRKRAELFNWDKIALKYVEVIESLMNLEGFDK
jgi:glycosyltransferase involved in cell wall biosynthesis